MKLDRHVMPVWLLFTSLAVLGAARGNAQGVDVTLSVTEPSGVARSNQVVTTGVPIPLSAAGGPFALFDGATEIPLQATVLPGVRTPWVLLDFRTTVGANQTKTLQLRSIAPTATFSDSVRVDSTSNTSQIDVYTGRIRVRFKKTPCNFIDAVWYDANGNGSFSSGEQLFSTGSGVDNLPLTGGTNGPGGTPATYTGKNPPTARYWEETGRLRKAFVIEGVYKNASTPLLLRYRTRFTFQAGQNHVIVEHVIRNCVQLEERYVKVRSAQLRIGAASFITQVVRSGDRRWVNPDSASTTVANARLELIPPTMPYRNAAGATTDLNVVSNGGAIVSDLSYHGATFCLDFTPGLTPTDRTNRTTAFKDRLMAHAPEQWYSDMGAFGSEHYGTYQNEKDTYTRWNWAPNPNTNADDEHLLPRPTAAYYPDWSNLHPSNDPESDDLWQHLMMWANTGHQTYLDRADGWARHLMWQRVSRTDGFLYAWDDYWEGPVTPPLYVTRTLNWLPSGSQTTADADFRSYTVLPRKGASSHQWNGGLVDYYYLTGNRDALNAAKDLAEQADRFISWRVVGQQNHSPAHNIRAEARDYLCFLRVWEAADSVRWRSKADKARDVILGSYWYDSRGFWGMPTANLGLDQQGQSYGTRFPNGIYMSPFGLGAVAVALYRDFVLTANAAVGARLEQMAVFAQQYGSDPANGWTGDDLVIDSPTPGAVLHLSYGQFRNTPGGPWTYPNEASSNSFIPALAVSWRRFGDYRRMEQCKTWWGFSSRGSLASPFSNSTQRGHFANSLQCCYYQSPDMLLFRNGGDLTYVQSFFREAALTDYVPPAPVMEVMAGLATLGTSVTWLNTGDDGASGAPAYYEVRLASSPITDEAAWAAASFVESGATSGQGTSQCIIVGTAQCSPYWFAVRLTDDVGNLSPMGTTAGGTTPCSGHSEPLCNGFKAMPFASEDGAPARLELGAAFPNPSRGLMAIRLGIPHADAQQRVDVSVFDLAGRRAATLHSGVLAPGWHQLQWDRRTGAGGMASPGMYYVRVSVGALQKVRSVLLLGN